MTDYYVDVVNGLAGNSGSISSPKQYISQAATSTAGNRVFLKRGQTHPISTYQFFGSNTVMDAYGSGAAPILQKTAGGDAWIYIQDSTGVTFQNFAINGNGFNGALISIRPTTTGSSGHLLQNLELYGSANHNGLYMEGSIAAPVTNITVRACSFHGNAFHGAVCVENSSNILFDSCVSYGNGVSIPAHGFSTYSSTTSPRVSGVTFRNCVSYGNIDFNGQEGQGFQFDNNSINCSFIGCLSYKNQGAGFAFNVGSGHTIIGCVASGNNKPGLVLNNNTGAIITSNIFNGNCRSTAAYAAEIVLQSDSTGGRLSKNILTSSDSLNPTGVSVDIGSATGVVIDSNWVYGFPTIASGVSHSNTIITPPRVSL